MKLTTLLLILALVQASAAGYSQITLKEKNAPLEKVLNDIEKQTKYVFLYDANDLNTGPVTVNVTNVTLEEALTQCFKNYPVDFTIEENNVLLKTKQVMIPVPVKQDFSSIEVHGRIVDETGLPLPAATVQIKNGKQQVTISDEKGFFTLKGVESNAIVVITMIGFEKKELPAAANTGDIKLSVASSKLDEVQVIAYGTTTARLNTGDVTSIKAAEIEEQPVSNPLLALEGRVPGMFITQSTGIPGSGVNIQLRGINSISNGYDPLFVVDGVPYPSQNLFLLNNSGVLGYGNGTSGSPLNYINPDDIESIDVLKDADATAIYGSRGANGVVLITTKKGKAGNMKVDITMQDGIGEVVHELPVLNTQQYLQMRVEALKNDGAVPNPNTDYDLTLWDTTRNTNWQKVLLGGKAQYTNVQATVSGGNANTQYLISTGYRYQGTVFPGDANDQSGSVHFNISSSSPNKKFRISLSGSYMTDNNDLSDIDLTQLAVQLPPDTPPLYNAGGSINWAPNAAGESSWPDQSNPIAEYLNTFNLKTQNLVSNSNLSYEVLPGLYVKNSFGYTNYQSNSINENPLSSHDPSVRSTIQSMSVFANSSQTTWIIEPQVSYNKNIAKGVLSALAGSTIQQSTSLGQSLEGTGFNSDLLLQDIQAATSITALSSISNSIYKYNAVFGRLNYNWQDKYLFDLTARRDGSSRFGPANRFANFYALGAGWIFTKEGFIQKNLPFLSYGKLRASYGSTGSDQIGDYTYLDLYNNVPYISVPYQGANGLMPTTIYTPNLQWELTRKLEGGIELGFLKDRITLNASYYRNRSSNELLGAQLPSTTGFTTIEENLPAVVQNKGWEFELNTVNVKSTDFRWKSSINLTMNRNELLSGAPGLSAYLQQKIGYPLSSSVLYHFLGVNPISGVFQFADSHGNPTSNPNPATDMTTVVDPDPKFYGGLQNSISYKSLQIDFLFQFVNRPQAPVYLYNGPPGYFSSSFAGANQPATVLSRWQKPGDVTTVERFSQNGSLENNFLNWESSDNAYGNGSYIRLKNLSFSWQIPLSWVKKVSMQNARIFIQGQNLLTITKYQGLDPENANFRPSSLPPLRVFTLGVQAIF